MATFDIQAARDAGYSEEEIQSYLNKNKNLQVAETPPAPTTQISAGEPPAPTTQVPDVSRAAETAALGVAAVPAMADVLSPTNLLGAYGAYKLGKEALGAMRGPGAGPTAPIAPTAGPVGTPANPIGGARVPVAPVAPGGNVVQGPWAQPQAAQPSLIDRTTDMIRQLAANKVVQNVIKGGAATAAALTPGNIGQDYMVPQTGRMRGMEINPLTGQPWTREQLQAYAANPTVFDAQLGPAQFRR